MNNEFDVIERIKELCSERNISYYRLSKLSGIPTSTLSNYMQRGNTPSIYTIQKICNALEITLSQFFSTGNKYQELTVAQKEILDIYSSLNPKERELLYMYMKVLKSE